MRKTCIIILCIFTAIVFNHTNVFALDIPRNSGEIDLGDGLVFRNTLPEDESSGYLASGLYKYGELVYAVDVFFDLGWELLYFSDDAMSFLSVPVIGGASSAIGFYNHGVFSHDYGVLSLLEGGEDALIPPYETNTFYQWDFGEQRYYNREINILRVTTAENIVISFDLSTGKIISSEKGQTQNNHNIAIIVGAGVFIFATVALIVITKNKRTK